MNKPINLSERKKFVDISKMDFVSRESNVPSNMFNIGTMILQYVGMARNVNSFFKIVASFPMKVSEYKQTKKELASFVKNVGIFPRAYIHMKTRVFVLPKGQTDHQKI